MKTRAIPIEKVKNFKHRRTLRMFKNVCEQRIDLLQEWDSILWEMYEQKKIKLSVYEELTGLFYRITSKAYRKGLEGASQECVDTDAYYFPREGDIVAYCEYDDDEQHNTIKTGIVTNVDCSSSPIDYIPTTWTIRPFDGSRDCVVDETGLEEGELIPVTSIISTFIKHNADSDKFLNDKVVGLYGLGLEATDV